jgi:hypothetical protein
MSVPPEYLVAIGLLAAVAFVAASAERRRRIASADPGTAGASEPPEPPLDEDMLGTIDLVPPGPIHDDRESAEPPA